METNYGKSKLLVIFLLTFASLTDLVAPLVVGDGDGFLGIVKIFFVLGVLFVLQDTFKWIRILLVGIIACLCIVWSAGAIVYAVRNFQYILMHKIFIPAAIPLYLSILVIGFFTYLFLRNYDIRK